nr:hypothetical protein [Fimbriiglobus sp.]
MSPRVLALAVFSVVSLSQAVVAQIPTLSSRPGAAYTMYMNFGGFNYTGTWAGGTPGTVAAYGGTTAQMTEIWARTAEKFAAFNINVTTVDPAVAAGQGGSDISRQNYYTTTARVMHS